MIRNQQNQRKKHKHNWELAPSGMLEKICLVCKCGKEKWLSSVG